MCFSTRRALFVDDWNDGQPRGVWLPDEPRPVLELEPAEDERSDRI